MNETLQPIAAAQVPHVRRVRLVPVRNAFLLALTVSGLGLLVLTVNRKKDHGAQEDAAWSATDHVPSGQPASPFELLQNILAHPDLIPTHNHSFLGREAPDFELTDPAGKVWSLKELRDGCPVVLIFYYGYDCVSCVRHLFDVHKDLPLFHEVGARVVAISADPPELTRLRFQQHGPFGFLVLSDPGNKAAQAYRVFKGTADFLRHGTFVIDRNGTVQWVNVSDAPLRRNPALLYQIAKLEGRLPSVGGSLP